MYKSRVWDPWLAIEKAGRVGDNRAGDEREHGRGDLPDGHAHARDGRRCTRLVCGKGFRAAPQSLCSCRWDAGDMRMGAWMATLSEH